MNFSDGFVMVVAIMLTFIGGEQVFFIITTAIKACFDKPFEYKWQRSPIAIICLGLSIALSLLLDIRNKL